MSPDHALALLSGLLRATLAVTGPLLAAALAGGLMVGIAQTATQINEASVAYVVKTAVVLAALLVAGPYMAERTVSYTRTTIASISQVVR
jgi:flagellar biosynthetic protein FliQ